MSPRLPVWVWLAAGCAPATVASPDGEPDAPDVGVSPEPDTGAPPQACGLTHDLRDPFVLEGEALAFTVGCALSDLGDAAVSAPGLPDGAAFDPATGAVTWTPDGDDAGRWSLTLSAENPGGAPESLVVTVDVVDDPDAPGGSGPDPETYFSEWGVPVVHIDPVGSLSESATSATITLDGQAVEGTIKVRGASSVYYPKQSYTLDFGDTELGVEPWGDRTRGHMYLISTFDDNSYVRQKLVFDTWAAMAEHQGAHRLTPRTFFAVVYLNGRYHGLYLGADRMDDEYTRHMGFSGDGDLYKSVSHDANFRLIDSRGDDKADLAMGWEKKEGADESDFDPLRALMAFTGGSDAEAFAAGAGDWLEVEEFVDWEILVTWAQAEDSAGKNAYLYRDDDTGLFRFSPWDFNASYGQNWYTARYPATYVHDFDHRNYVFSLFDVHPDLSALRRARTAALTEPGAPLTAAWQLDQIDGYYGLIERSAQRDWGRWADDYGGFDRWESTRDGASDWQDFDGERAYLESWLVEREAIMADWPDE